MHRIWVAVVAAAVLAAPARAGWEGSVDYQGTGSGLSGFDVRLNSSTTTWSGWVGEYKYQFLSTAPSATAPAPFGLDLGDVIHSYCLDLQTTLQDPSFSRERGLTDGLLSGPNAADRAGRMAWIASNAANLNAAEDGATVGNNVHGAGIQLALWELLYDDTASLSGGSFQAFANQATGSRADAVAYANQVLTASAANAAGWGGTWFEQFNQTQTHSGQDFMGIGWVPGDGPNPVPAPPALVMGLIGFAGIAGLRRLRRI